MSKSCTERFRRPIGYGRNDEAINLPTLRHEAFAIANHLSNAHKESHVWGDMTMHASKGLEFPVVALPGVGHMPAAGEDEADAARVFYVVATRATRRLVIGVSGNEVFGKRLEINRARADFLHERIYKAPNDELAQSS